MSQGGAGAEREVVVHWDRPALSDDAIVVRGGRMRGDLPYNAQSVFLESGLRGICGAAGEPPATADTLAKESPYKGDLLCESTLGELRKLGFDVVMVDDPPHCVVLLMSEDLGIDSPIWDLLRSAFTEPRPIGS